MTFVCAYVIYSFVHLPINFRGCNVRRGICEMVRGAPPHSVRAKSCTPRTPS